MLYYFLNTYILTENYIKLIALDHLKIINYLVSLSIDIHSCVYLPFVLMFL